MRYNGSINSCSSVSGSNEFTNEEPATTHFKFYVKREYKHNNFYSCSNFILISQEKEHRHKKQKTIVFDKRKETNLFDCDCSFLFFFCFLEKETTDITTICVLHLFGFFFKRCFTRPACRLCFPYNSLYDKLNSMRVSIGRYLTARVPLFLFLPHFDVICDLLLNRRTATPIC